jgi:hypothetical protein
MDEKNSLQDLDTDIVRQILKLVPSKFAIRCVSTKLRAAVEQMPGLSIVLSEAGSQNATLEFFLRFSEPIVISKQNCNEGSPWIAGLCCAIQRGLIVQRLVLPTETNEDTALKVALGLKHRLAGHHANVGALEFGFALNTVSLGHEIESIRQLSEVYSLTVHVVISCSVPAPRYPLENEMGYSISSMQRLDGFAEVRSLQLR